MPAANAVQVGNTSYPNTLSFYGLTTAVMLGAPLRPGTDGKYTVSTVIDPQVGGTAAGEWNSLVLSRSRTSRGYAANGDAELGLIVGGGGALEVWSDNVKIWNGTVTAAPTYTVSLTVSTLGDRHAVLTVNGTTFTVTAPGGLNRWPSTPYLYLGTYFTSSTAVSTFGPLHVSNVDTSVLSGSQLFADTFDGVLDDASTYGLNSSLRARQPAVVSSQYTRTSGLWNTSTPPQAWYSQVDHVSQPDRLAFFLGPSAVRLNKPIVGGVVDGGRYAVHALVDPVAGETTGGDWASINLSASAATDGYPSAASTDLGLTLRSNGRLQAFQHGTATWAAEKQATPAADGSFDVTVSILDARNVAVVINGTRFDVVLTADRPTTAYLTLGSYTTVSSEVSWFDDVRATKLGGLSYYGYFGTISPGETTNHMPEVNPYTNMNQVLISPEDNNYLDYCRPRTCGLFTEWRQYSGGLLRSDSVAQLQALKDQAGSNLDKVGTLYMIDEPYINTKHVSAADLQTGADQLVAMFPGIPLTLTLDALTLPNATTIVPTGVDYTGFDDYCASSTTLTNELNALKGKLRSSTQQLYLIPESGMNQCGYSDAQLSSKQDTYKTIATNDVRVVMLMNFGWFYLDGIGNTQDPFHQIPTTAAKQTSIGDGITGQ